VDESHARDQVWHRLGGSISSLPDPASDHAKAAVKSCARSQADSSVYRFRFKSGEARFRFAIFFQRRFDQDDLFFASQVLQWSMVNSRHTHRSASRERNVLLVRNRFIASRSHTTPYGAHKHFVTRFCGSIPQSREQLPEGKDAYRETMVETCGKTPEPEPSVKGLPPEKKQPQPGWHYLRVATPGRSPNFGEYHKGQNKFCGQPVFMLCRA
jgi:hypothetical protein